MKFFGYPEILLSIAVGVVAGIVCSTVPLLKCGSRRECVGSIIFVTGLLALGVNIALAYHYHDPAEYWREQLFLTEDDGFVLLVLSVAVALIALPFAWLTRAAIERLSSSRRERGRHPRGLRGKP